MASVEWDVDDRPATWVTRLYIRSMRVARSKQRKGDRRPTAWTRLSRRVSTSTVGGLHVWTVRPRSRAPVARILYVHGGGYVHPLTVDYWRLVRGLTRAPAEVVVPAYPLAPGATVDDVLPALLAVYEHVCQDGTPTFLMGDSAGGALVIVMARHLRDHPSAPTGTIALCPWLDATLDESEVAGLEASDPMLAESGLRAAGRWWAGTRPASDPEVSPVTGDLTGLGPLDVLIGDRDILRPAVDRLARAAEVAEIQLHVHEVPAMFHVWMTRPIPEGRRTRRLLAKLVSERR